MRLKKEIDIESESVEEPKDLTSTVESALVRDGYIEDPLILEGQLLTVFRLKLRKATIKQIATALTISTDRAKELIQLSDKKIAEALRNKDPMLLVAEGEAFYDEIIAKAMTLLDKVSSGNITKTHDIVRVLEIALRARSEKDKFLVNTGILNNNQQTESVREDEYAAQATEVKGMLADVMTSIREEETLLDK